MNQTTVTEPLLYGMIISLVTSLECVKYKRIITFKRDQNKQIRRHYDYRSIRLRNDEFLSVGLI